MRFRSLAVLLAFAAACRDSGPTANSPAALLQREQAPPPDVATLTRTLPGFGGLFVDHGVPTVYLTDLKQQGLAERLLSRFARARGAAGIRVMAGRFAYRDLDKWFQQVSDEAFSQGGVVFVDLDETLCSIGFNAVSNGQNSFVTASHCTTTQGGVEGTQYWQSLSSQPNSFIGTEVADPVYVRGKGHGSACPKNRRCRMSDAARVAYAAGVPFTLGGIAQTSGPNNGSLTITGTFAINGEGGEIAGDIANKVGRTTGWTQGVITNTCVNTGVSGSNIVQLCQNFVSAGVGGGDSGSDVFAQTGGNGARLLGVLWGGNSNGTQFVYSPIANVESELGPLTTF